MNCGRCNNQIEPERIKVLPATRVCAACARVLNPPRVRGRMIFDCKTNPTIDIMSKEEFDSQERFYPKFGRGSAIHRISKPTSSM